MIFVIDATAMLILYCLSAGVSSLCILVLLSYWVHVLDRLCVKESRSFLEFCMDMKFVDLDLHDIIFGRISRFASGKSLY